MKFAVLICSVILVAAAHPYGSHDSHSSWTEKIEAIQIKIQNAIDTGLSEVTSVIELGKKKAISVEKNLKQKIETYETAITKQVNIVLEETNEKLEELAEEAGHVDIKQCLALGSSLPALAEEAIKNLTECAEKRLKTGEGYIEALIQESDILIYNLTSIRQEAENCAENVDDIKSAGKAIVCSDIAAAKALWASAKGVPIVTASVAKLTYLQTTLSFSLSHCSNNHGFKQFVSECERVLEAAKHCEQKKIWESEHKLIHEYIQHGDKYHNEPRNEAQPKAQSDESKA